jgi:hypothetical protein
MEPIVQFCHPAEPALYDRSLDESDFDNDFGATPGDWFDIDNNFPRTGLIALLTCQRC